MKKVFVLFVLICTVLTFSACADSNPSQEDSDSQNETVTQSQSVTSSVVTAENIKGTIDGNVYTNKFLNLTVTASGKWGFLPEEAVISQGENYDMIAIDAATGAHIKLAFEDLTATASPGLTTEDYVNNISNAASEHPEASTITDQSEITIGGNKYIKLTLYSVIDNRPSTLYEYIRVVDNYAAILVATVPSEKVTDVNIDALLS